ncbi:hypothetical protein MJ_0433 [Methanocaldococcus jannaschii DSM 2661]|uniref:Uncharacterized protein MJ0433 n=1 Tax=Methanocaldococcus jannaschii (strain ATCC 43067 / DSM 2661 / JAL-1 / JCM 10045 / NBRC 100440) TaxID=243232 RepID=Y433_METJA|nr:hypothetical protein [Methanocaldococcus jannaschii]Q57875.1 RecName: Full=Uncharacterized protein MJ0433 [Methanocaldococcus jannaschii DSM 2661]AAB98433.1 hypothetical protein MJ_0433 [Methanocaldococcus jannaschii DSM 2661]
MDAKEILELVEESYKSEDGDYKNKVYFISYFLSSLIFVLIHISIKYWNFNILFIVSLLLIIGSILIVRQQKLYKKTRCYFDKIFEKIVKYGMIAVVLSSVITLYTYPRISGVAIAGIFGFLLVIDGILFKSKKRKFLGLLMMFSSIPMFIFHEYQFLIFAFVQFLVALCFLICKE